MSSLRSTEKRSGENGSHKNDRELKRTKKKFLRKIQSLVKHVVRLYITSTEVAFLIIDYVHSFWVVNVTTA